MRKHLVVFFTICLFAVVGFGQKLPKPTELSAPLTAEQTKTLRIGIALHDAKKYDEAIAAYDKIIAENPSATAAMYEKGMSQYAKGDRDGAMETAYIGAKFKCDELALFYGIMASCLDDVGKGDEAIKIYRQAEDMLTSDIGMQRHLAIVYYNLGVTYMGQKKYTEAKAELKKSIEANFAYASPNYLLAKIYDGSKYKMPAFFAAARFVSLEFNTQRTLATTDIIHKTLAPAERNPKTGNMEINLDFFAQKDEGDFAMFDIVLPTLGMIDKEKKGEKAKTPNELFISGLDTIITMAAEDKKLKDTFVGKTYIPFMAELKAKGHLNAFGYMLIFIKDNTNADAGKWIGDNGPKLDAFLRWASEYELATK